LSPTWCPITWSPQTTAWWFPEKKDDFGWDWSNIDMVTDNDLDSCDQAMGTTNLRVLLCAIKKAENRGP